VDGQVEREVVPRAPDGREMHHDTGLLVECEADLLGLPTSR
jgi:hypothetical protein